MDKNFAIDVSGCSQEQIKEMADWLCERFGAEVCSAYNALDVVGTFKYLYIEPSKNNLLVANGDNCKKYTYNQALEIMQQEQIEYKEQSAHKADVAMGEAINLMDKAGHDIRDEVFKNDMIKKPNHYQLLPEYEVKDILKALLDKVEESDFEMTLYEAAWYQQAMQYFMRAYAKNGLEDFKKGVETMQFVVDSMESRNEPK